MTPWRTLPRDLCGLSLLVVLSACAADDGGHDLQLTVFAASSLRDAFTALEPAFEAAHPGIDASVAFAGSQVLRLQIERGAKADVFASAHAGHVRALVDAGLMSSHGAFARNELAVAVPIDNELDIQSFADLPKATRIVLGTEEVPIGRYTAELLERSATELGPQFTSGVLRNVISREPNVRLVRAKVELGEADAAIVYRTDVIGSSAVTALPIPAHLQPVIDYHIAVAEGSTVGERWTEYLRTPGAREILVRHRFLPTP